MKDNKKNAKASELSSALSGKKVQVHDQSMDLGKGGELHRCTDNIKHTLTTQTGTAISDDQNSLKGGESGPVLMEDFALRDKLFHFDHERIPERVVHARGFGAHGYFENYASQAHLTQAQLFQKPGERTPVFVRFSTVAGSKGSPDLARDVRGFAVKFYTQAGNWDLVGNNIPVFFIQDSIKFPDLIHAAKEEPNSGFPQAQTAHDNFWDFISLTPESMHMVMWIMSDRAIPRSLRFMEGFGVHTFRLVSAAGKSTFVKFHWKPVLGVQSVTWAEALRINGADPDYHRRDLWSAIQNRQYPSWELGFQLFDEEFCEKFPFDVLDATKLIPEELVPVKTVGRLVLDRCVDNFFAETEQVAFCTQNIVPGIDFTDDPLLQGRNFSYLDTQLKRLGSPNFNYLPVNRPQCPFANFQQDGHMAFNNPKGRVNYNPNSWGENLRENPSQGFHSYPSSHESPKRRQRPEKFSDHFSQARQFYHSQTAIEQKHIVHALTFELSKVETEVIQVRMLAQLQNIDKDLAKKVGQALGFSDLPPAVTPLKSAIKDLAHSPKLSILANPPKSFEGRHVGILISSETEAKFLHAIQKNLEQGKIASTLIAPKIHGNKLDDGSEIKADQTIEGAPSALFDSIIILFASKKEDRKNSVLIESFIKDAYFHGKFIAYGQDSESLLRNIGIFDHFDAGCICLKDQSSIQSYLKACEKIRYWDRIA